MFERFTDSARRIVVLAQEESRGQNHDWIGTEHLLLALFHNRDESGDPVLTEALPAIRLDEVRAQVGRIVPAGSSAPYGHIPFTLRAKKVLEQSLREATRLRCGYIAPGHLLLGMLSLPDSVSVRVLVELNVDIAELRKRVTELSTNWDEPPPTGHSSARMTLSGGFVSRSELGARVDYLEEQVRLLTDEVRTLRGRLDKGR
ncbi:MAG TPA: Clp protease N-terminal domain-containing protein [Pseudonocardiaceae bacterium]|nr:Clp protease N-terminal domain-containing protein [Pseudonocardiaceae bacterium]